jgi:hypothetical protein
MEHPGQHERQWQHDKSYRQRKQVYFPRVSRSHRLLSSNKTSDREPRLTAKSSEMPQCEQPIKCILTVESVIGPVTMK